jgi:hypothetical protein
MIRTPPYSGANQRIIAFHTSFHYVYTSILPACLLALLHYILDSDGGLSNGGGELLIASHARAGGFGDPSQYYLLT